METPAVSIEKKLDGSGFIVTLMDLKTMRIHGSESFDSRESVDNRLNELRQQYPNLQEFTLSDPKEELEVDIDGQIGGDELSDLGVMPVPPADDASPGEIESYKQALIDNDQFVGEGSASSLPEKPEQQKSETTQETLDQNAINAADSLIDNLASGLGNISLGLPKFDAASKAAVSDGKAMPALNFGVNGKPPPEGSRGMLGEPLLEPVPFYNKLDDDVVMQGTNNTWICMTRDRPGSKLTGYGAGLEPQTQAGAIDLVVGRMSPHVESKTKKGEPLSVDPNFTEEVDEYGNIVVDAARVYITQKADIDDYFKIVDTKKGVGNIKTRSAIAAKADAVRILARDGGIKLVTQERGKTNSVFSRPNNAKETRGIDIIAGNDDTFLQPMVLGQNLSNFLVDLLESIDRVVGTVAKMESDLMTLAGVLMFHVHPQTGPAAGVPTAFSPEVTMVGWNIVLDGLTKQLFSIFGEKWDMNRLQNDYLRSGSDREKAIMSKFNNVN